MCKKYKIRDLISLSDTFLMSGIHTVSQKSNCLKLHFCKTVSNLNW